jgi:peptidoglycan LD-endopeptidase CwlK
MLIFVALLYFCVACSLIWLVCFPTGRARIHGFWFGLRSRLGRVNVRGPVLAREPWQARWRWRALAGALDSTLRRHWIVLAIGVPAIAIPSLLALVMRAPDML